jgi:hypothetical protein
VSCPGCGAPKASPCRYCGRVDDLRIVDATLNGEFKYLAMYKAYMDRALARTRRDSRPVNFWSGLLGLAWGMFR